MVLLGVLLAGLALALILSWWTDGLIGATEGIILFVLYGGLIMGLFAAKTIHLRVIVLIPLLVSAAWGGYALKKGSLRQYYRDQIKRFRSVVDFDPANMAARRELAESLYKTGNLEMAISELQVLVSMATKSIEERYLLKQWEQELHLRKTGNSLCIRCGTEYGRGTNWCKRCEGPVTRYGAKSWLADAGLKTFMVVFASLTLVALSFIVLSPVYAFIPTVCLLFILGGWKMLTAR